MQPHPSLTLLQEKALADGFAGEMSVNAHKSAHRTQEKGGGITPAA